MGCADAAPTICGPAQTDPPGCHPRSVPRLDKNPMWTQKKCRGNALKRCPFDAAYCEDAARNRLMRSKDTIRRQLVDP